MKLVEAEAKGPRARRVVLQDGVYVHVGDLRSALKDDQLVLESVAMVKVGREKGHHPVNGLRHAIGYFVATLARQVKRIEGHDPITVKGGLEPYTKSNVVALAALIEFSLAAGEERLSGQEMARAALEAIKGLERIVLEVVPEG